MNLLRSSNFSRTLLAAALIFSSTSCATIMHGSTQPFAVRSTPNHAMLTVDGDKIGQTPVSVDLRRGEDHKLMVKLAGFQAQSIHLQKKLSGWIFGNVIFGGIIGIAIDAGTGAMYNLSPLEMEDCLQSHGVMFNLESNTITIVLVKNSKHKWHRMGHLTKI